MKIYFVVTGTHVEVKALKTVRPPDLLMSYFYVRKKSKSIPSIIQKIEYTPNRIILDSGAYTAWKKKANITLLQYMEFIHNHRKYLWRYINLDVIGDDESSFNNFMEMRDHGFNPIPVWHYEGDWEYLKLYAGMSKYIFLGGSVGQPVKVKASWVAEVKKRYPNHQFHLLGSSTKQMLDSGLESSDSSTWIMGANMGHPKHIIGKNAEMRTERAIWNLRNELHLFS